MRRTRRRTSSLVVGLSLFAACTEPASQSTDETPATTSAATDGSTSTASMSTTTSVPPVATFEMPAGQLLVYSSLAGERGGMYSVINFPDLTVEPFEPLNSDSWFVDWEHVLSPNGQFVAFSRSVNLDYGHSTLYVMDLATGETTQLLDGYESNGTPTWTADSRFLGFDNFNTDLYVYDTQTGDVSRTSVSTEWADASAISPAGDRIAYKGACPQILVQCPVDLYVVNSDGSNERFLELGAMDWLFWSADGRLLYYSLFGTRETYGTAGALTGYRLYVLDLETGISTIVDDPHFNSQAHGPTFISPNGDFLLYDMGESMKVTSTSDRTVIGRVSSGDPAWTPDNRYVVSIPFDGEWACFDVTNATSSTFMPDSGFLGPEAVGWLL